MNTFIRRTTAGLTAAVVAGSLGALALSSPATAAPGTRSLATVLDADGNKFDRSGNDFDIVDRAVRVVLKNKPESPVAVLADGDVRVTAFVPTDRAFFRLVKDLTGTAPESEKSRGCSTSTAATSRSPTASTGCCGRSISDPGPAGASRRPGPGPPGVSVLAVDQAAAHEGGVHAHRP
jgi:hypothetical protein